MARQTLRADVSTVTVGLVDGSGKTYHRVRRHAQIDRTLPAVLSAALSTLDDARNTCTAAASTVRSTMSNDSTCVRPAATDVLRRDMLEALAHELADGHGFDRSRTVREGPSSSSWRCAEAPWSRGGGRRPERGCRQARPEHRHDACTASPEHVAAPSAGVGVRSAAEALHPRCAQKSSSRRRRRSA